MDYKWPKIIVTTLHMVSCVPSLNLGCFALQNLTEHGRSDAIPAYKGLTASNTHSWNPDKEATLTVSPISIERGTSQSSQSFLIRQNTT